jgi:hypothetical protein
LRENLSSVSAPSSYDYSAGGTGGPYREIAVAKSKRGKSEGEKYIPVPVNAQTATALEVEAHLRAFITTFIQYPARHRWEHCLLVVPHKANKQLGHFHTDLDGAHCRRICGAAGFPLRLAGVYGNELGVYFDGNPTSLLVTAAEAATLATEDFSDAVFSLAPGRRVLVFDHEGGVWACER